MVMERTEAQKVFIDLSIDEDVIDESECSDSSIDNEDMYRDIFADDPDSSDDEDFTFCIDDKEIKLFLRSKSIK